jgi:hypothetical protein
MLSNGGGQLLLSKPAGRLAGNRSGKKPSMRLADRCGYRALAGATLKLHANRLIFFVSPHHPTVQDGLITIDDEVEPVRDLACQRQLQARTFGGEILNDAIDVADGAPSNRRAVR